MVAEPYPPELYEALHRGNPGDIGRYAEILSTNSRVLELGCGAGRVAIALGKLGHRVTGLDVDPAFIDLARARSKSLSAAPDWVVADMRDFSLAGAFDVVIAPFNTLYCLADLSTCLNAVAEHLAPGGRLLFDVYDVEDFHELVEDDEDIFEDIATIEVAGERVDVAERALWDKAAQRLDVDYRYRWKGARDEIYRITHHYRTQAQLRDALERSGFEVESVEPLAPSTDDEGSSVLFAARLLG